MVVGAHGFFHPSSSSPEEEGAEPPLWLMAPAVGVARRLGGELVEMGLARCVRRLNDFDLL